MDNTMMATGKIEQLTNKNYHVLALKVGAALRSRRIFKDVIENDEPPVTNNVRTREGKDRLLWETKNDEAFDIIILTLSDEHAGLFLGGTSAKKVWNELKNMYMCQAEDQIIDIGLELRNIRMRNHEPVIYYINRAKNIASRSAILVLRAQRDITLEDVQRILCEEDHLKPNNGHYHSEGNLTNEKAYRASHDKPKRTNGCNICGRHNHLAKDCFHRNDRRENKGTRGRPNPKNRRGFRFGNKREHSNMATENHEEYAFRVSIQATRYEEDDGNSLCNKQTWIVDSGTSSHMSPDAACMTNIEPYSTKERANENEDTSGSLCTREIGGAKVNVMLWHQRLGHICKEYLTKMRRKEMVRGLNYPIQSLGTCEVCIMGKGSQVPHQRQREICERSTRFDSYRFMRTNADKIS
ncbi:hypothetical protein ANTPLA_LOCUS4843 [Anthophora plagiata]